MARREFSGRYMTDEFAPELRSRLIFFMKFSNDLWTLESLREGNLYMNTIGYYREKKGSTNVVYIEQIVDYKQHRCYIISGGILW